MLDDKRLLVVDDEPAVCQCCQRLFARQGLRVDTSSDALEGLRLAIRNDYAVILLDVKMPIMSGIQFLEILRKNKPDVPVIVVTGCPGADSRAAAKRLGAAEYVCKPFTPEDITRAVQRLLRHPHRNGQNGPEAFPPSGTRRRVSAAPSLSGAEDTSTPARASRPRAKAGRTPQDARTTQGDHAMFKHTKTVGRHLPWLVLAALAAAASPAVLAQEVLRLYGASEVSPAIEVAAMKFSQRYDVRVDVIVGSPSTWLERAKQDADLVFTDDLATMSHFIYSRELPIDAGSVAPLYVRPAVILVRPGNPKNIHGLPDLVKPGLKVMIANGAGRAGLWKELATTMGNGEMLRALNQNTVFVPGNTTDAMELWKEWADIDAWITWNIWHMPLRHRAQVVPLSSDYSFLRQCAIALTQRSAGKALAVEFKKYLTSTGGAEVFESWAWARPLPSWNALGIRNHVCLACQIADDDHKGAPGSALARMRNLIGDYKSAGVAPTDVHISAIVEGDASYALLKDAPYSAATKKGPSNPNSAVVGELLKSGVSLELSVQTMKEKGWTKEDILPGVKIVDSADTRIDELEQQGYARMQL